MDYSCKHGGVLFPFGFIDGPSVYAYARGNPHAFVDPDGRIIPGLLLRCLTSAGCRTAAGAGAFALFDLIQQLTEQQSECSEFEIDIPRLVGAAAEGGIIGLGGAGPGLGKPKYPAFTQGTKDFIRDTLRQTDASKARKMRDLIPPKTREIISRHYDAVARHNRLNKGRGNNDIQIQLQTGRSRFMRGKTNTPPGSGQNFNPGSLR